MIRRGYTRLKLPSRVSYNPVLFQFRRSLSSELEELRNETVCNELDLTTTSTGVMAENGNETIFYFDNLYHLSLSKLSIFANKYIDLRSNEDVLKKVVSITQSEELPYPQGTIIKEFVPLKRDGGGFVKFEHSAEVSSKELNSIITENLKKYNDHQTKGIFSYVFTKVWNRVPRAFIVNGIPWIEDLNRFPSTRLKVFFEDKKLSEEELYVLFRRYGPIVDIVPYSSATNYATIIFKHIRCAITAKNCVTGIRLGKERSTLHIKYLPLKRVNYIKDFVVNHQRISVPAILAILATIAVLVFDPIREWCIEAKISQKYSLNAYKKNIYFSAIYSQYKKLKALISDSYDFLDEKISHELKLGGENDSNVFDIDHDRGGMLWDERTEKSKLLNLWLNENLNTFIVVRGPKGSGKQEFVFDYALKDSQTPRKVLHISCDEIVNSKSDSSLIKNTALQLGYFPIFTWVNSISQFVDLGVQSITGQKSGLSESKETQLKNMFLLTTLALKNVGVNEYKKYRSKALKEQKKKKRSSKSDIEEEIMTADEFLVQHPEAKPIVVVNKYIGRSHNEFFYKMIADWSVDLVQNNLAHVIYITSDIGSILYLNEAMPNKIFRTITLSDASLKSSKQYLLHHLESDFKSKDSLDMCLESIGGRMLDLQSFVRRIKSGESPQQALEEMIIQATEQITTFFLNKDSGEYVRNWKTSQVWELMKILSKDDCVHYLDLVKSPLFKDSDETLETLATLERHELISLERDRGILCSITTGRPLFKSAFKNLIDDLRMYKIYESKRLNDLIALENSKILKLEDELVKICIVSNMNGRLDYLRNKIDDSNKRIIEYEKSIKEISSLSYEKVNTFLGIKY